MKLTKTERQWVKEVKLRLNYWKRRKGDSVETWHDAMFVRILDRLGIK